MDIANMDTPDNKKEIRDVDVEIVNTGENFQVYDVDINLSCESFINEILTFLGYHWVKDENYWVYVNNYGSRLVKFVFT